jgi:hypothetical protein
MGFGIVTGFGIAISLGIIGAAAGFLAATVAFTLAFILAFATGFALALIFFFGAARFATFLTALRTTRTIFLTERLMLERDDDARIFAFAFGRFFDFLFFAMVRLLLTELFNTRV